MNSSTRSNSVLTIKKAKELGQKISMVTCYDAAFARLVEQSSIDMVLVGDSLGNVALGYDNTLQVTLADMIHHSSAVSRVLKRPLICADMPFMTYQVSTEQALENAGQLIQKGGAHCVKLEGGAEICPQVSRIVSAGIPVVGHLGLMPQKVNAIGGYRVQGRSEAERQELFKDIRALEAAGVFAVVLEMVPADLASELSKEVSIPTIGIGAGLGCDGQVLVLHDLLGFDSTFAPKFLKKYADVGSLVRECLNQFDAEVKDQSFPDLAHSF